MGIMGILEKMISTNISTVQFQDEKKEPKPTIDAMLIWSLCEEEEQLEMLSSKQNPGIGTHLGSGETFEIIEGEVNKRTKYWKFIALYENSLKKVKGKMNEKRLVQYWGWSHGQVWCGGYHDQESNYMDKKLRPYVDQCFLYPLTENWQSPV